MNDDPRRVHTEGIAGPGSPHDPDAILVSAANAVLMDHISVAMAGPRRITDTGVETGEPVAVLNLGGRINRTAERTEIMFAFDPVDGSATLIAELLGLAHRWGGDESLARLMERVETLVDAALGAGDG